MVSKKKQRKTDEYQITITRKSCMELRQWFAEKWTRLMGHPTRTRLPPAGLRPSISRNQDGCTPSRPTRTYVLRT